MTANHFLYSAAVSSYNFPSYSSQFAADDEISKSSATIVFLEFEVITLIFFAHSPAKVHCFLKQARLQMVRHMYQDLSLHEAFLHP